MIFIYYRAQKSFSSFGTQLSKVERKHPDYLEHIQGVFFLVILIENRKNYWCLGTDP
jgi:hypothetical protein